MASFDYDVVIIGSGFGGTVTAMGRGLQTREAEMELSAMLGELGA